MLYTTYLDEPNDSPHLRHFKPLYGRGNVPEAKFAYEYFDEVPVEVPPFALADKTTLEDAVLDDRFNPDTGEFTLTRFSEVRPHHVHLKFNLSPDDIYAVTLLPYTNLLIQQNLAKMPVGRLIVTVFEPGNAEQIILDSRKLQGYAGAIADQMLVDKL